MTQKYTQVITNEDGNTSSYTGFITPFPGSSDIAVSHGVYKMSGVASLGKEANMERCATLQAEGYSLVIATVNDENTKQKNILSACGWDYLYSYYNKRTRNKIQIWVKPL